MTAAVPSGPRPVRAPRGTALSCRGWPQEAAMRMLMNNLDPEVAEHPDQLIVGRSPAPAGQAGHLFGKSGQRGTRRRRIHHPATSETAGWSRN